MKQASFILNQKMCLPNCGTEAAVGGAASTRMSKRTRKLPKRLIAEKRKEKTIELIVM